MEFTKYSDIENSDRKKFLDAIIEQRLDEGEFVVQEKAHGANLSFWYNGQEMRSAKRTSFIEDDFYGYKSVEEENRSRIAVLYNLLKK